MNYKEYLEKKRRFTEGVKDQGKPQIKIPSFEEYLEYRKLCDHFEHFCTVPCSDFSTGTDLGYLVDLFQNYTEKDYDAFEDNLRKIMIDLEYVNPDEGIHTSELDEICNDLQVTKDNFKRQIYDLFGRCMEQNCPKTYTSQGGVEVYTDIFNHQVKVSVATRLGITADDTGDGTY